MVITNEELQKIVYLFRLSTTAQVPIMHYTYNTTYLDIKLTGYVPTSDKYFLQKTKSQSIENIITFSISTESVDSVDPVDSTDSKHIFFDFIDLLGQNNYTFDESNQREQSVYTLKVSKTETVTETPNPLYQEWSESLKEIMDLKVPSPASTDTSKSDDVNSLIVKHMCDSMGDKPPKTINNIKIKKTVTSDLVKANVYKPFNRLYIAEEDHTRIYKGLLMFRDRADILKSYRLPNKFGLLMYGEAGTGKTSTIYAIATMLCKPIYYINLTSQTTCSDLNDMFNYVYTIKGGGIIVFEEIDKMTDIVISDTLIETCATSIGDLKELVDDRLTLSYFLNFLDGLLTYDKSVVIVSTNNPQKLDTAFKRTGRFDIQMEFKLATHQQIITISKQFINRSPSLDVLSRIQEYKYRPVDIMYRLKDYVIDNSSSDEEIFRPFF